MIDAGTGEVRPALIFVAVMGASNYTYAEATLTQSLPDWIGAIIGHRQAHSNRLAAAWSKPGVVHRPINCRMTSFTVPYHR